MTTTGTRAGVRFVVDGTCRQEEPRFPGAIGTTGREPAQVGDEHDLVPVQVEGERGRSESGKAVVFAPSCV